MSLPERKYKVVVYEIVDDAQPDLRQGHSGVLTGVIKAAEHTVTGTDPWCAVKHWAEQIEVEETS